ncbi:class IV adenylate cyclase [bacterium]|nr:class IV adenylate cyclase [bacterium]
MPRNIEIKARVNDPEETRKLLDSLNDSPYEILSQKDMFFHTREGRLKLRFLGDGSAELISYNRQDEVGPKQSEYTICPVQHPDLLLKALSDSLGVAGIVEKTRVLRHVGQTRVHLDRVKGLGDYLELEVVLRPDQSEEEGRSIAEELMRRLGIRSESLIAGAYVDILPH